MTERFTVTAGDMGFDSTTKASWIRVRSTLTDQEVAMRWKTVMWLVLLSVSLLAPLSPDAFEVACPASPTVTFTLLHMNDVYELIPGSGRNLGGLGRVATVKKALLTKYPNTFTATLRQVERREGGRDPPCKRLLEEWRSAGNGPMNSQAPVQRTYKLGSAGAVGDCTASSTPGTLNSMQRVVEQKKEMSMPANNFNNSQGNFTVSDAPLAGRNAAVTGLNWTFDDFEALHRATTGLTVQNIPSGSPSVQTYRSWFNSSGLFLYTNP
jgi:hypothetical protein